MRKLEELAGNELQDILSYVDDIDENMCEILNLADDLWSKYIIKGLFNLRTKINEAPKYIDEIREAVEKELDKFVQCKRCKGDGGYYWRGKDWMHCESCDGSGFVRKCSHDWDNMKHMQVGCMCGIGGETCRCKCDSNEKINIWTRKCKLCEQVETFKWDGKEFIHENK